MIDGRNRGYGGRRNVCVNNKNYIEYAIRIVGAIAEHYKDNRNVIGYQIDNELMAEKPYCYCETCQKEFRDWLKQKYTTIDELNKAWGLVFWSLSFSNWDEVTIPRACNQPSALFNFYKFSSDSYIKFANISANEIRKFSKNKMVTHNICSSGFLYRMDLYKLFSKLDVVSIDNYPSLYRLQYEYGNYEQIPYNHTETSFALAMTRSYKKKPFWITEKQTNDGIKTGMVRLWTYQEAAHGGRLFSVFSWRKFQFGAEQDWGAVLGFDSVPRRGYYEIQKTAQEFLKLDEISNADVYSNVAIVRDFDSDLAFEGVNQNYQTFHYLEHLHKYYDAIVRNNITCDIVSPDDDFSKYSVVIAPSFIIIDEIRKEKIEQYVENGGTYITTVFSATRNAENVCHMLTRPCLIDELCGIEVEETAHNPINCKIETQSKVYNAEISSDIVHCITATPLATYKEAYFEDSTAITVNTFGKGKIYYIGTAPERNFLIEFLRNILTENNIKSLATSTSAYVEIIENRYNNQVYLYILNFGDESAEIMLDGIFYDIVSDKEYCNVLTVKKLDACVLKRK
jgi:beta-galactosidase